MTNNHDNHYPNDVPNCIECGKPVSFGLGYVRDETGKIRAYTNEWMSTFSESSLNGVVKSFKPIATVPILPPMPNEPLRSFYETENAF